MRLSVVIPTHKRHRPLLNLVSSIQEQSLPESEFELILVSNLADPFFEKPEFKAAIEGIDCQVYFSGQVGVNKARNIGIEVSKGEVLLYLDDDCVLTDSQYFEKVLNFHKRFDKAIAIGGGYKVKNQASALDKAYNCVSRQWQALDHFGSYESSRLVGGNVSYKRDMLLESHQLFDESISFGGTESEFHMRLVKRGFVTLYIPQLLVEHRTQLCQEDLVRKAFLQAEGYRKYEIEEGFSRKASRTYQNKRLLLAREEARSDAEFDEMVTGMGLYDWAYNFSLDNPGVSPGKVLSKARSWLSTQEKV